jgi:O-antigen ligase
MLKKVNYNSRLNLFSFIFLIMFFNYCHYAGYNEDSDPLIAAQFLGPVLVIILLIYININKLPSFYPKWTVRVFGVFVCWLLIIAFFQKEDVFDSLKVFTAFTITYLIAILTARVLHNIPIRKVFGRLLNIIVLIVLPVNLLIQIVSVGGLVLFPDRSLDDGLRFGGGLYHAHNGMVLGIAFLINLFLIVIYKERNPQRIFYGAVLIIAILLTDCRSVWTGLIISVSYIVYIIAAGKNKKLIRSLAILLGSMYYMYSVVYTPKHTQSNGERDLSYRSQIWAMAVGGIAMSPVVGYGKNNYFQTNADNLDQDVTQGGRLIDPHNAYLDLMLQSGIITLVIFLVMYFMVFRNYRKHLNPLFKPIFTIFFFWIFLPFFWGRIYNGQSGFITFFFPFTIWAIILHPGLKLLNNNESTAIDHNSNPVV